MLPSQIAAVGTTVVPGNQAAFPGPLAQITGAGSAPFTFDSVRAGGAANALTAQYKAATILTAFPAYPNSEAQLHRVIVKPGDVKTAMPEAFRKQLEKCYGPTLEIKIGADIETARMAWLDSKAELIEQAFGVSSPKGDITEALEAITLNDIKAYWKHGFVPGGSIIGFAGRFDWDALRNQVGELLGDWKGSRGEAKPTTQPPRG